MIFRKDINGLRAIAVILVVAFHFKLSFISGGFAGVDVFFVISGYLMTMIIFSKLEAEKFSIIEFYVARASRIIPPLAFLCITLLILGWIFITPEDYRLLGKHSLASMVFLSNIAYLRESGYFDVSAYDKWLLHTWSLSVEWQFYIIYPIALTFIYKFLSLLKMRIAVLIFTILGFSLSLYMSFNYPDSAYYSLTSRGWELLAGACAYLFPFKFRRLKLKKYCEFLGVVFILISCFFDESSIWPGYLALFPVLGTFFIIQSNRQNSFITGNLLFQFIGRYSYSIYLWHWPVVVAFSYYSFSELYLGVIISLLLGFLSGKYIESIEFKRNIGIWSLIIFKPFLSVFVVATMGGAVFVFDGFRDRFSLLGIGKELVMPSRDNDYCFNTYTSNNFKVDKDVGVNCYLGDKNAQPNTLLFGDSYAGHSEPFLNEIFNKNGQSFQSITTNWCAPSFTSEYSGPYNAQSYQQCLLNRKYLESNYERYDNIIIAGSWDSIKSTNGFEEVKKLIKTISDSGVNIVILSAPYRFIKNPLNGFLKEYYLGVDYDIKGYTGQDQLMSQANEELKILSDDIDNVFYIGRNSLYNKNNEFKVDDIDGFIPYTFDGTHISVLGSKESARHFMGKEDYNILKKMLFPTTLN